MDNLITTDDDYSIEYIDEDTVYNEPKSKDATGLERMVLNDNINPIDDDDAYTYEEESLEVVMEDDGVDDKRDIDTSDEPPSVPKRRPTTIKNEDISISPVVESGPNIIKYYALPSKQRLAELHTKRAKDAGSSGLSELSKQLRILQAKNESQSVEISRLERQIKILADLQGISVKDLRSALNIACENEAFAEMKSRVSKLKHELEAATLAKRVEILKDSASSHIANLELRLGELEEIEESSKKKIERLYDDLRRSRGNSTRSESENNQLKKALQSMIHRLKSESARATDLETKLQFENQRLQQEQSKRMKEEAAHTSLSSSREPNNGMAKEYENMVSLLKQKDEQLRFKQAEIHANEIRQAEKLIEAEERALKVQMNMKVEMDKLRLNVKELEDTDSQSNLRLAQFKARFAVQNGRIVDMGQQLESLYTGFTLLKEEFDAEHEGRATMLSHLNEADAVIANTMEKEENDRIRKISSNGEQSLDEVVSSPSGRNSNSSLQSVPMFINTSPTSSTGADNTRSSVMMAPVSPRTPATSSTEYIASVDTTNRAVNNTGIGYITPTFTRAPVLSSSPPQRTPTTWQLVFPDHRHQVSSPSSVTTDNEERSSLNDVSNQYRHHQVLISGSLIVESNSVLRKWKTKRSKIYLRGEGYQWELGDKKSFPLQFGISKVEYNPNHALSFAVFLDPNVPSAPVIRAACSTENEYHCWMRALHKATAGFDDMHDEAIPPEWLSPHQHRRGRKLDFYNSSSVSVQEGEDTALQRILEISKHDV